jgi:hypothetical protein
MKRIFALALVTALWLIAMIPQVQAVEWETYKDPKGRFEMKYPADWKCTEGGFMVIVTFEGPNGISASVRAIHDKSEFTKVGKEHVDSTTTVGGHTTRTVHICGEKYGGIFVFSAPKKDFDSANKTYFDPMIKSVKVK